MNKEELIKKWEKEFDNKVVLNNKEWYISTKEYNFGLKITKNRVIFNPNAGGMTKKGLLLILKTMDWLNNEENK